MRLNLFFIAVFITIFFNTLSAQEDIQIGTQKYSRTTQSGFFDFSDPAGINIKVQIWGYVKYPGYYIIPARSSANDLMSLAGGPTEDAKLDDIRLLHTNPDSSTIISQYDYDNLLWGDQLNFAIRFPRLSAGDMLIVPGEPRYFLRQDVSFYLSVTTALASIAALILSITK